MVQFLSADIVVVHHRSDLDSQGYREYCALARQHQGYTSCPGHRSRRKQLKGIASGDLVQIRHRRHGVLRGYAALDKRKSRVGINHQGRNVSVKPQDVVLTCEEQRIQNRH